MKSRLLSCAVLYLVFVAVQAQAVNIYVNKTNTGGPWDGKAPATAFTNIQDAVDDMLATNLLVQGGHTVQVTAGTYFETVSINSANHSGLNGSPNTIITTAGATVDGVTRCFYIAAADYITIDGFDLTGGSTDGILFGSSTDYTLIRNCNIYNNAGTGINMGGSAHVYNGLAEYCNIFGNGGDGVYLYNYTSISVRNCNIVNNSYYGCNERRGPSHITIAYLAYNNIYANGCGAMFDNTGPGNYDGVIRPTVDDVNNNVASCSNNISANPGFADLYPNWNFNSVYAGSPILNASEDGTDIGAHQNPPETATSANTYYVATPAGGGNDGNPGTLGSPWATISKAATAAIAGDTVMVAAGTYSEDVTISEGGVEGAPVTYQADGAAVVDGTTAAFTLERVLGVVLDGFETIGSTYGVYFSASAGNILRDASSHGNTHGVYFTGGGNANTIRNCDLYANTTYGVYLRQAASGNSFEQTLIRNNSNRGVYSAPVSARLGANQFVNSVIIRNGSIGVHLETYSGYTVPPALLENCVVANNNSHGLYLNYYCKALVKNTVFANNTGYGAVEVRGDGDQCRIDSVNCDYYGNTSGQFWDERGSGNWNGTNLDTAAEINLLAEPLQSCTNNIVEDPLFVDEANDIYRITSASPCLDAGTDSSDLGTDYYGSPRLMGAAVDIGIHEVPPPGTVIVIK